MTVKLKVQKGRADVAVAQVVWQRNVEHATFVRI